MLIVIQTVFFFHQHGLQEQTLGYTDDVVSLKTVIIIGFFRHMVHFFVSFQRACGINY